MTTTRITWELAAPRATVYRALIDPAAVQIWMVPDGMTSRVHEFDAREGGRFRVSLTYQGVRGTGKTSAHTDTYSGRFVRLRGDREVVETMAFETPDPAMQGEMTVSFRLREGDTGTVLVAEHSGLPPGLDPGDNELGWRMSLAKLAALVGESRPPE